VVWLQVLGGGRVRRLRLFLEAFGRLVAPHYAGPEHTDVPGWLLPLSRFSPEIAAHFFRTQAPAYDLRPRLPEIAVPALVVVGRWDWVCPPAASRALAAGLPAAHLAELPDAGHFGFSEEPEAFRAAVRPFLAAVHARHPGAVAAA
jgi:proline iminopeptidase